MICFSQLAKAQSRDSLKEDTKYRSDKKSNPLYIVDGIKNTNDLKGIDPSNIQGISVLKGKAAFDLYGSAGANGVILITMKHLHPVDSLKTKD